MPITAMVILQYGSYFRAQSHGMVFESITSALMAKFLDYSLSISQFCIGFVMLAGAGSNLNQQFGLPLWVGSALMVALVLAAGMFNVDKVTNMIGTITPVMILVLLAAAVYGVANPPDDIAMALITEMNPALGIFASVATYLMIFSTALGVFYSLGKRVSVAAPNRYRIIFTVVTLAGFALSFFDFTLLVANVFPWLGWLGIVLIAVLLITWLSRGRRRITAETEPTAVGEDPAAPDADAGITTTDADADAKNARPGDATDR